MKMYCKSLKIYYKTQVIENGLYNNREKLVSFDASDGYICILLEEGVYNILEISDAYYKYLYNIIGDDEESSDEIKEEALFTFKFSIPTTEVIRIETTS